jgi:hypothetical protein
MSNTATRPEEERVTPERTSAMQSLKQCVGTVLRATFILVMLGLVIVEFTDPDRFDGPDWSDYVMLRIIALGDQTVAYVLAVLVTIGSHVVTYVVEPFEAYVMPGLAPIAYHIAQRVLESFLLVLSRIVDWFEWFYVTDWLEWPLFSLYRLQAFIYSLCDQQQATMTNLCISLVPLVVPGVLLILINGPPWFETPKETVAVVAEEAEDDVSRTVRLVPTAENGYVMAIH